MTYFDQLQLSEDEKRNIAFQSIVSLRDTIGIALDRQQPPTYEQAFSVLHEHSPELYDEFTKLIKHKNDSDTVKFYKEKAELQTINTGLQVEPIQLVNQEINELSELLASYQERSDEEKERKKYINQKLALLYAAKENLEPRKLTENRILNRDYSKVDRTNLFGEKEFENDFYIDYKLNTERSLRLRLLHPDKPEHLIGADLVYEQYDIPNERVRFVFLQYKTWDNGVLYFNSGNLIRQIQKLKDALCDQDICKKGTQSEDNNFRFPCCSGFLRPTDRMQHADSKMISTGYHIPICTALSIANKQNKIEKNVIKDNSVNHKIFEELFRLGLIGSRWININSADELYKKYEIIKPIETIRYFAREFIE